MNARQLHDDSIVTETLLARSHPERVVRKIMGANWQRIFAEVWGE